MMDITSTAPRWLRTWWNGLDWDHRVIISGEEIYRGKYIYIKNKKV